MPIAFRSSASRRTGRSATRFASRRASPPCSSLCSCGHFHVRRAAIDAAADLGYQRIGGVRLSVAEQDLVLAQLTKSVLPILGGDARTSPLALDHLELLVGAHVMQRYGASRPSRTVARGGLAPWQRRRATELLRENLDGTVRLADVAQACELSVSHFARSFKASFGASCHRWLTERRIERTKELLAATDTPLVEVASQGGFGDQAAFTRTLRRLVGLSPGRWRRERQSAAKVRRAQSELAITTRAPSEQGATSVYWTTDAGTCNGTGADKTNYICQADDDP